MTTDNDELLDDLDSDDDDTPAEGEGADGSGDGDQTAPSLEDVLARVAKLESATAAHTRDLTAAVGRFQSLQAKVDAGSATAAEVRALSVAQAAAQEAIDAIAEDEALDPTVRTKAAAARSRAATKLAEDEKAALQARLDALESRGTAAAAPAGVDPFEQELWDMIESFGLEKTDPIFDWKGEATNLLMNQGQAATRRYFTAKIRERLATEDTSDRRQMRKSAGKVGGSPAASTGVKELDASRPIEDRLKYLQSIGAIS